MPKKSLSVHQENNGVKLIDPKKGSLMDNMIYGTNNVVDPDKLDPFRRVLLNKNRRQ